MNIQLLDCTLRDGGYVNDWNFKRDTAISVLERLAAAGIDILEVGFLDERQPFNPERTIQPDSICFDRIFGGIDRHNSMLVAMIDYGTCSLEHIAPCAESILDGIRVIFKQPKMRDAVAFGYELRKLGYKVFLQMVSITSYSDKDILDFVEIVNEIVPYAVSIVDTYGLMHKDELLHYFHLLDYNLNPGIRIGYHAHNNFQLAYSNTCEVIKRKGQHDILVDGTVYGMGKSAGNAPLELIAMYLNENYGKRYDINQILEVIDTHILRIYHQKYWGYSLLYFLSASNDCHPSYIDYLLSKKSLPVKAINEIAKRIPIEDKLEFKRTVIESLYVDYQKETFQSEHYLQMLQNKLAHKSVLLLGPGKTLITCRDKIGKYMKSIKPMTISVNFIPEMYTPDFVFISNAKRYDLIRSEFIRNKSSFAIIATSNITAVNKAFDYIVNYADVIDRDRLIEDNSLIMLLKVLCECSPDSIMLAGFDGFAQQVNANYYNEAMDFSADYERMSAVNAAIAKRLPELRKKVNISFLTPSQYEETFID